MTPAVPRRRAFTLIELMVSIAVMVLLIAIIAQLFNAAAATTSAGNKHMNCDAQARAVLDRLAIDLGQMVLRPDIDYYVKSTTYPQTGNDQLAFCSQVPGYYPAAALRSPASLVAYRINEDTGSTSNPNLYKMQRLGKGLLWSGASAATAPLIYLPLTISATWPTAVGMGTDNDYELIGPQVFRFEYDYLLRGQTLSGVSYPALQSDCPWDTRIAGHTSINGFQDVAALVVMIAVIDGKDRNAISQAQLAALSRKMNDYAATMQQGELAAQWQSVLDDPANGLPRGVASRIRLYHRSYYLNDHPAFSL